MSSLPDSDGEDDRVRIGWQPDAAKLRGARRDTSAAQARPAARRLSSRILRSRAPPRCTARALRGRRCVAT